MATGDKSGVNTQEVKASEDTVTLTYKPPTGEPWVKTVPKKQAEKMLKLGRWKRK